MIDDLYWSVSAGVFPADRLPETSHLPTPIDNSGAYDGDQYDGDKTEYIGCHPPEQASNNRTFGYRYSTAGVRSARSAAPQHSDQSHMAGRTRRPAMLHVAGQMLAMSCKGGRGIHLFRLAFRGLLPASGM
jgi:hypothetical protein